MEHPLEVLDWLAYNVDESYRFVKLHSCTYKPAANTLATVFLFDQIIESKLENLKPRLEREYRETVSLDVSHIFTYEKSYIDPDILKLKVQNFLHKQFSVLTLDLDDNDIKVEESASFHFIVNIFLPEQNINYISKSRALAEFVKTLHDEHFATFQILLNPKKQTSDDGEGLDKLERYMKSALPADSHDVKVDKSLKIRNVEYLLGKPIRERPIKIEFLRVSSEEQIIAGTISNLTRREYTKKDTNEQKPYFTLILDDGRARTSCIFFPNPKALPKFEQLQNGTQIVTTGENSERNGRTGFRISGISFCELV